MARRIVLSFAIAVLGSGVASAQAPSAKNAANESTTTPAGTTAASAAPPAAAQGASPADPLSEPPGFSYNAEGRRDPFVSLLRRGTTARTGPAVSRPAGLAGVSVDEIALRGTLKNRETFVGIAQGADQRTYIVRPGDKLLDGTIRSISQNEMVIVQQVNDPLSRQKQREVRKMLRQIEAK